MSNAGVDFVARYFTDALGVDEDEFADAAARCVAPLRRALGGRVATVRPLPWQRCQCALSPRAAGGRVARSKSTATAR